MLRFRRPLLPLAALLLVALAAHGQQDAHPAPRPGAPAWRQVQDKDGLCQWAIPRNWHPIAGEDTLIQFGQGRAAASLHHNPMKDWEQFKDHIKLQYQPAKVMEDSADRLWFQYAKGKDGVHYYVARPAGAAACAAQIDITDRADLKTLGPVAERIAASVGPVPPATP